jgi:hypothetical protein
VPLIACLLLLPARASGQTVEDQATARALFDEGRALMAGEKYDEACPKLEAASKLYAGSGVLLNLGDCYEHIGRTASAWTEFAEAASAAERARRADDKAEADRRHAALEPKLAKLAIQVAAPAPGLIVYRDGTPLSPGAWNTPAPVDPGRHAVRVQAPGRADWSSTVTVTDAGKTVTVQVPELQALVRTATATAGALLPPQDQAMAPGPPTPGAPSAGMAPETVDATTSFWTARRVVGAATAGTGAVGMAVGGVLGLAAKSKYTTAQGESGAPRHDDSASAVSTGNIATAFVAVGAVVVAGGVVLWLTAPSGPVHVGIRGSEAFLAGSF